MPSNFLHQHPNPIRYHKKILLSSLVPDVGNFIIKFSGQRKYQLFKTVFFEQIRLSADPTNVLGKTHDGCLMYRSNDVPAIGFLETIISFDDSIEPVLVVRPVVLVSTADSVSINQRKYKCHNVLYGTSNGTSLEVTSLKYFIQKLAFRPGIDVKLPSIHNPMFFFQYPNLSGST